MDQIVIDASVLLKLFFPDEEHSTNAVELKNALLENRISVIAPSLIIYEMINTLESKKTATEGMRIAIRSAYDYGMELREIDVRFAEFTASVASKYEISAYDASYIALAQMYGATFYTADQKLLDKTKKLAFVKHIKSFTN